MVPYVSLPMLMLGEVVVVIEDSDVIHSQLFLHPYPFSSPLLLLQLHLCPPSTNPPPTPSAP